MENNNLIFPVIHVGKTGQRIRQLRLEHGFSVRELAEYMSLASLDSIYHWENGRSVPTIDNLYILSELYNASMNDLLVWAK